MTGVDHEPEVCVMLNDWRTEPRYFYATCRCGVCGPMRDTAIEAQADREAHIRAIITNAVAGG